MMGLGRTVQTLALIAYLLEVKQRRGLILVIAPLNTISNWIPELEQLARRLLGSSTLVIPPKDIVFTAERWLLWATMYCSQCTS